MIGQTSLIGYGDYGESVQTDTLEILSAAEHYNRWIFSVFEPYLGSRILEVGCGIGTYTQMLLNTELVKNVISLEMQPDYIERLNSRITVPTGKRLEARCQNILEDTVGLEGLNGVMMLNVLEHIKDDAQCLGVLKGLLEPGGKLLILVPALPWLYSEYDRSISHYRRYTKQSLKAVVEGQGFQIRKLQYFNALGIAGWWVRFCVLKQTQFEPKSVRLFNALSPALQSLERLIPPPLGLSLVVVAEKPL
jgi:2-polyprenyl-3-methyl-5-hydroxy-6-metoxy-1,4-benzoquinol methylase